LTEDLKQQIDELYNNPQPASLRQKWSAFIDSDSPGARLTRGTLVLVLLLLLPIIGLLVQLLAGLFFAVVLIVAAVALFLFILW
jgi:hypothetical protein